MSSKWCHRPLPQSLVSTGTSRNDEAAKSPPEKARQPGAEERTKSPGRVLYTAAPLESWSSMVGSGPHLTQTVFFPGRHSPAGERKRRGVPS